MKENTQDTSKKAKPQNENAFERACRLRTNGVSVSRTAAACGVSHTTIRRWETTDSKWQDIWDRKKKEIEESTQSGSDTKDETSFLALTAELLNNFGIRELKDFCLAFRDDHGIIENPQIIHILESVCAKASVSDLQLVNWLRRRAKNI